MKTLCSEFFNKYAILEETKDVRHGKSVHYRTNETPDDVFQQKLDDELSGKAKIDDDQRLDDVWLDALRKQRVKEKQREPAFAFSISAKMEK